MKNAKRSNLAANAAVDAMAALLNDGWMDIYSGVQPASGDDAPAGTRLAALRFGNPAFQAGVAGIATANAITSDADADASGAATWYRLTKSDHTTAVQDGSVATSNANLVLDNVAIVIHTLVAVSAFALRENK